jgi:hypothetical protein
MTDGQLFVAGWCIVVLVVVFGCALAARLRR